MRAATLLWLPIVLGACGIPEHSPMMKPGQNCLSSGCHGPGASRHWYAAGTVFADPNAKVDEGVQGVEVRLTDAKNRKLSLGTNGAGNFYTAETLDFPLQSAEVWLNGKLNNQMGKQNLDNDQRGACNACHDGSTQGRIFVTR